MTFAATLAGLQWAARLSGLVVALGYVAIVLSHLLQPHSAPPSQFREWLGIALLSTACLAGLLAWRWQLTGAMLSLAALGLFVIVIRLDQPLVIAVIATPGILYSLSWIAQRLVPTTRPS
jgi:hypothetical protein